MSSTLDRMRRLQNLRPQKNKPELTYTPLDENGEPLPPGPVSARGGLDELLQGIEIENSAGQCYMTISAVPLNEWRGGDRLAAVLDDSPACLAPFHPEFSLDNCTAYTRAAYIDTETTGLGTGAGVYAFLVGVGTFEPWQTPREYAPPLGAAPTHFVVRQFFMRHPGEEAALLSAVADTVLGRDLVVTFNGRGFDLPLLRARYQMNRNLLPAAHRSVSLFEEDGPHLDLLLPARRLWRRRLQSCRLINLEQNILGLQRNEDDVPGSLIPQLYIDYLRTQQAGELRRVFYHNREDIISMVLLGHHLVQAYQVALEQTDALYAEDLFSLAKCYLRQGDSTLAERAWRAAADTAQDDQLRADIFAAWALMLKRQERWHEAAELWQRWLTSVSSVDATPFVELAKYHEWHTSDLEQAEMWAAWGLHTVEAAPAQRRLPGQLADLHHRLERIRRKRHS